MQAAYIHILTDIILSLGVILSALLIYFCAPGKKWSYWQLADPLSTYLFSVMALYSTIPVTREATLLLLDTLDKPELYTLIEEELKNLPNTDVKSLKIWTLSKDKYEATVNLTAPAESLAHIEYLFSSRHIECTIQLSAGS